jgi:prepilin-type N-terminal cleavage/methylation domain-containing protein
MVSRCRSGFTMAEMLVVLAIIAILAGFLVTGINLLRSQAEATRTRSILAMTVNALASGGAASSQTLAAVEHPLAASAAPRDDFVRSDGTPVSSTGVAIQTSDPAYVAAAEQSLIVSDDDRYVDPDAPAFYGLERWRMRVLGAATRWVTSYRRITGPGQPGRLIEPDLGVWVDEGFLRQAVDDPASLVWEQASDQAVKVALGASLEELLTLGAIRQADPDRDPLIRHDRLRRFNAPGQLGGTGNWEPGTIFDQSSGQHLAYALRGMSLIDVWGREILIGRTPQGGLRVESAGRDGIFAWDPGPDGVHQTAPDASQPAGDDRDGAKDNIVLGGQE